MNRLFQTDGIILKSMKLNESDKIVTIFSKNYGKIRAIVKGIRKTKSHFGSSMENLTMVKLLVFKGKNLSIVSQAEIIHSFFQYCKDLKRFGLAIQCAELVDKLSAEEDPNHSIYELLKTVLILLQDDKNPVLLVESFKWKLFMILGYQPELIRCIQCKRQIPKLPSYIFDIEKGGLICSAHQEINSHFQTTISDYGLRLLKRIMDVDLADIHNKAIHQSGLVELIRITDQFMNYHFDIENQSKQFLNKIKLLAEKEQ